MITFLLIVHGLVAVALLGAITHQAIAICWSGRNNNSITSALRAVNAAIYTKAIIILFLLSTLLGGVIYPAYRMAVRTYLENARLWNANGSFELKEQFVAIALGMLPLYWFIWRKPLDPALARARQAVTLMIAFAAWFGFIVGHVLNNIRGLFGL